MLEVVDEEEGGTDGVTESEAAVVSVARNDGGVTIGVPLGAPLTAADCDAVAEGVAGVRMPGACVKIPITPEGFGFGPTQLLTRNSRVLTPATKPPPVGTKNECS